MQWLAHTETHRYYRYKYIWRYTEVYMCGDRHVIESMCDRVCGKVHLQRPHIGVAAFQFYCCALQSRGCIHWAGKTAKKGGK